MSRPPLSHWENLPEVPAQEDVTQMGVVPLLHVVKGTRFLPQRAILMEFEPLIVVQMGVVIKGDNHFKSFGI
jgi:hypothetical protein